MESPATVMYNIEVGRRQLLIALDKAIQAGVDLYLPEVVSQFRRWKDEWIAGRIALPDFRQWLKHQADYYCEKDRAYADYIGYLLDPKIKKEE